MQSILSNKHECLICGNIYGLDKHHIYGGGNRSVSEENGFWCYLCRRHHTMTVYSVHGDPEHKLDHELKAMCQSLYERDHTRDEFIRLIGKSYK